MKRISFFKGAVAGLAMAGMLATAFSGTALAEGMTKEQGDAILNELRQIRQLLGRQQQAPAPNEPAAPERVRLKLGKENALGKIDAPLVMVEYTDYQCPFCSRFYTTTYPELKKEYIEPGKMRFITRDFPLEFHPFAMKAAVATHCAGEQGKFWQMKDALMSNSSRLSADLINNLAQERGLSLDSFKSCMDSGRYDRTIADEVAAAKGVGIGGTPSFVIGKVSGEYLDGYLVVGAQPFANFDAVARKVLSEGK